MKNQLQYFICRICAFLFFPLTGLAQDIHFDLAQRPEDQIGLQILSLVQDNMGFLWIGTSNGLYKYNGIQYTDYQKQLTKPNSMSGDWVECLAADKQGYIWVGYYHNTLGLDRLDPATGIWNHFHHNVNDIYSIANDSVAAILEDHEGIIWIGTPNGLDRFDSRTNRFYHYQHAEKNPASLSCNQVRSIYEDKEGTIWVGTGSPWPIENQRKEGGLNKLDRKTGNFIRYLHDEKDTHSLSDNRIRAMFEDSQGNFWVGSAGDGLHKMDRRNGSFERLLYDPAHPDGLSRPPLGQPVNGGDDHITFIMEDNRYQLWIGTFNGGVNVYDPAIKKSTWYGLGKNSKEKLQDNSFWTACKTEDGLLWIGSVTSNLYKISPFRVIVPHTHVGTQVFAFAEDNAKTLWLATNRGLVHQDSLGALHWFLIEKDSSAGWNSIAFIEKDDHNRLWLATYHGLYYIDPGTDKIFNYLSDNRNIKNLLSDNIYIISKSRDGYLWLGTYNQGLKLLNVKSGSVIKYEHNPADSNSISNNGINSITKDRDENLWVGTYSGLNRLNKLNGHFKTYLKKLSVTWVQEDSAGDIWAGTITGFFRYDRNTDSFLPFTDQAEVIKSNTAVFGIAEDPQRFLWLDTWKGILQLNKDRNKAVLFGKNQGINPVVLTNIGYTRQSGEVLFGDSAGFYTFNHTQWQKDTVTPALNINSFLLNDLAVEPSPHGILTDPLQRTKTIRLNHDQNTFSIVFSVVDFVSNHEDSRLLYMLQNYDDGWRLSNDNRGAYYFNLPPGKYVFKVKAVGSNGRSVEKQIGIIITPPWWATWWAYTFYIVSLLAGILFTDRIRRKVVIERERAKTKERELAQAKEIEKAYTELKATQSQLIQSEKMASLGELTAGIAHEIQNPLNFVNNFSEVNKELLQEMKTELMQGNNQDAISIADNIIANEDKIIRHGQRADAIVKGMLQHSRSDTGVKEPTNINALADEYLRLSYHGLRARDKSFNATLNTNFDQHIGLINIIPQDIGRMLLNLFNNAFYAVSEKKKNTTGDYEPTVTLTTKKVNNKVEIRVRDNGNGIPAKIKDKIFQPFFTTKPAGQGTGLGLSLNYDIAKAHGGEISVDSKEGEFTEFVVMIPTG